MFKSNQEYKGGSNLTLAELSAQEENQKCFDCGNYHLSNTYIDKSPANWASINNGIFLCYDCGNEHKAFCSTAISTIKSTTMDIITENYLKLMRTGGNFRLKAFLETYGLPSSLSKKAIYSSKLINFYRRKLKAEANGEDFIETIPLKSQFWESYSGTNGSNYPMPISSGNDFNMNPSSQGNQQQEESSSIIPSFISAGASSLWGSVWGTTTSVASAVKNKLNETEVGTKILTVGGNAVDAIKDTGSKVYEKGSELYATGKEKTVAAITYTGGQIYEKGTEIIQGEVVKNIAAQAGNSMVYIKDKIVNTVQEATQNKPNPNQNQNNQNSSL